MREYQLTEVLNSQGDRKITRFDSVNEAYAEYIKLTTEKPDVLARMEYRECGPWYVESATDLNLFSKPILVEQPPVEASAPAMPSPTAEGCASAERH